MAKQVFEEQKRKKWPGLYKEVKEICRLWGLENVCHGKEKKMTKYKWKKLLKNVVNEKNKQGLKSLNPRPNSLFYTNSWYPTSMQNLESVAQKMAEL